MSEFESLVAAFQREGGKIEEVPDGKTSRQPAAPALPFAFTNRDLDRKAEAQKVRMNAQKYSEEDDLALIRVMHTVKAEAINTRDLCRLICCTNDRIQRLLRVYLADDKTLDRFRAMSREERIAMEDKHLVDAIRKLLAEGMTGKALIAKSCGASYQRVTRVADKYKIIIPRGEIAQAEDGHIGVPIGQLKRWASYANDHQLDELEHEIMRVLAREKA